MSFVYDAGTYAHPDGIRKIWNPLHAETNISIIAQSGAPIVTTGNFADAAIASVVVPGGAIGPQGALRIWHIWSATNSAGGKIPKILFGGTPFFTLTMTTHLAGCYMTILYNRGLTAQIAPPIGATGSGVGLPLTSGINTGIDQIVQFNAAIGVGGDQLTLERYQVEVLYG